MKKKDLNFELDPNAIKGTHYIEICWVCKHRHKCPLGWECETIENLDNDDTGNGVE